MRYLIDTNIFVLHTQKIAPEDDFFVLELDVVLGTEIAYYLRR